ncbi:hypothetical protein ACHQM5_007510 [Ranunculus cassubicifolius]
MEHVKDIKMEPANIGWKNIKSILLLNGLISLLLINISMMKFGFVNQSVGIRKLQKNFSDLQLSQVKHLRSMSAE